MTASSRLAVALLLASSLLLAAPARAFLNGENVLMPLPDGFHAGEENITGDIQVSNFFTTGENDSHWSEKISVTSDSGQAGQDPTKFAYAEGLRWIQSCPGGTGAQVSSGFTNGYRVALWEFDCASMNGTGQPWLVWLKAISTPERFYAIRFTVISPRSEALALQVMRYLGYVGICDMRGSVHPCPADGKVPKLPPEPSADKPADEGPGGVAATGRLAIGAAPVGADSVPAQSAPATQK